VDPLLFLRTVRDEKGADLRLDDIVEASVRNHISKTDLEDIVRSKNFKIDAAAAEEILSTREDIALDAPVRVGREELTRRMLEDARKQTAEYGIELVDIRLKRVNYVQEVRQKVEDRMISERQRIAETFRSEGRGKSAEILGEMQRDLSEIRSEAERRAEEVRGGADAEVTRIYGEAYGADPEFFAFLRTLESYGSTINANTTLMLPADSEYFRYLREIKGDGATQGTPATP
jgi:membrane protease subunit HflC